MCPKGKISWYEFESEHKIIGSKADINFDITYDESSVEGKVMHILMVLDAAPRFLKDVYNYDADVVHCNWPKAGDGVSNAWNWIRLQEEDWENTVVLHEYGHCFEHMIKVIPKTSYIRDHSATIDLTSKGSKEGGCYTAFLEGFATAFERMVVNYYKDSILKNYRGCDLPGVFDYLSSSGVKQNFLWGIYQCGYGEGYEYSIITLLLCLIYPSVDYIDKSTVKEMPTPFFEKPYKVEDLKLPIAELFNLLVSIRKDFTFNSFNNAFEKKYKNTRTLLKYHYLLTITHIAPYDLKIQEQKNTSYVISFKYGGGCNEEDSGKTYKGKTKQELAKVCFYNSKFEKEDNEITVSKNKKIIEIPKRNDAKPFYISLKGESLEKDYPTGFYESGFLKIDNKYDYVKFEGSTIAGIATTKIIGQSSGKFKDYKGKTSPIKPKKKEDDD